MQRLSRSTRELWSTIVDVVAVGREPNGGSSLSGASENARRCRSVERIASAWPARICSSRHVAELRRELLVVEHALQDEALGRERDHVAVSLDSWNSEPVLVASSMTSRLSNIIAIDAAPSSSLNVARVAATRSVDLVELLAQQRGEHLAVELALRRDRVARRRAGDR